MDFDLAHGTAVLRRTPAALAALLDGLPPGWAEGDEGPGTWSPRQVVAHLLHGERTDWIPRARVILARGETRRFPPFDRAAHLQEAAGRPLEALLADFARERAASLRVLEGWSLGEAELSLKGEHPEFGEVMLRQLLATWVAHDLAHLAQVGRTMARQLRDAVGPWRAYLSVMDR